MAKNKQDKQNKKPDEFKRGFNLGQLIASGISTANAVGDESIDEANGVVKSQYHSKEASNSDTPIRDSIKESMENNPRAFIKRRLYDEISSKTPLPESKQIKEYVHDLTKLKKQAEKLTDRGRAQIKDSNFVFPEKKKYPIHDKTHARAALRFVAMHGDSSEKQKVKNAVKNKYPDISVNEK
jgi:hypothetical protein